MCRRAPNDVFAAGFAAGGLAGFVPPACARAEAIMPSCAAAAVTAAAPRKRRRCRSISSEVVSIGISLAPPSGAESAERECEDLDAGIEELDLEVALADRTALSDQ